MLVIVWSLWLGALVGTMLKLASPHRNALSWIFAGLVGALGAMIGVYVARFGGIPADHRFAHYLCVALVACGVVLVYAGVSRRLHRAALQRGRATRPTIVF